MLVKSVNFIHFHSVLKPNVTVFIANSRIYIHNKALMFEYNVFVDGYQEYELSEPGMKKQINMDATGAVISEIEKKHHCVIERDNNDPVKVGEKTEEDAEESRVETTGEEATVIVDGAAGNSGTSTMNLPHNSMSFVNDKEVKMASGHKISIVVGDLAHQQVYF